MIQQHPLTLIADILPGHQAALSDVLNSIGQDIEENPLLRFAEIETTHFARFVMIGGGGLDDRDAQTRLYFSANHDGPTDAFLDDLIQYAPAAMFHIFSHCKGFTDLPCEHPDFPARCKAYLQGQIKPTHVFYQGYPGRSVTDVHNAIALHKRLREFKNQPQFEPLLAALGHLPAKPLAAHHKGPVAQVAGKALSTIVERIFTPEISQDATPKPSHTVDTKPELTDWLYTVQNEMTVISAIEPSKLERLTNFLKVLNFAAAKIYNKGTLGGIATIHFARWAIIDGGQNLLFESNYDGNWEQYIGDFVDKASLGMDGVWSNCTGYPPRGSKDLQAFKQIILDHQVRAHVFYSAYRYESIRNILDHLAISERLDAVINRPAVADLLYRV